MKGGITISYLKQTMMDFPEKRVPIQEVIINRLLSELYELYRAQGIGMKEQLDCLGFINTLFRIKHRFLLDYNKEKRSYNRNTQLFHLKKIQAIAKTRIRPVKQPYKKYKPTEEVTEFRKLIFSLNRKLQSDLSEKTKKLLDELMKERWTVQEKTSLLKKLLDKNTAKFNDLLESEDKEEIITSFLAILDLKRKGEINVIQQRNFGEIIIENPYTDMMKSIE